MVDYLTPEEVSRISEGELEVKPFLEGGASEGGEVGEAGEAGEAVEMEITDTKQQGTACYSRELVSKHARKLMPILFIPCFWCNYQQCFY